MCDAAVNYMPDEPPLTIFKGQNLFSLAKLEVGPGRVLKCVKMIMWQVCRPFKLRRYSQFLITQSIRPKRKRINRSNPSKNRRQIDIHCAYIMTSTLLCSFFAHNASSQLMDIFANCNGSPKTACEYIIAITEQFSSGLT